MPLPGTPIYKNPSKYGITILDDNLSRYNRHQYRRTPDGITSAPWSPIDVDGMTHEELLADIGRMHQFVETHTDLNRGDSGNFGTEEVHKQSGEVHDASGGTDILP